MGCIREFFHRLGKYPLEISKQLYYNLFDYRNFFKNCEGIGAAIHVTPRRLYKLFQWFFILLVFGVFAAVFCQALQRPTVYRMEKRCQLVHLEAVGLTEDNGDTIYRQVLSDCTWSRPVCAVTARQTPFIVELDGHPHL